MVSERVVLGNFGGLGNGHLWEFGLPEAGPDLGKFSKVKSSDYSREILANSGTLNPVLQELLPHTP